MKSKTIKIQEKSYEIKALPLGKYANLLNKLETIPQQLGSLDEISEDKLVSVLPSLIATSFPELVSILSVASDIDEKTLSEEMTLNDAVTIIEAIFEVNEFKNMGKAVKGLFAKAKTK